MKSQKVENAHPNRAQGSRPYPTTAPRTPTTARCSVCSTSGTDRQLHAHSVTRSRAYSQLLRLRRPYARASHFPSARAHRDRVRMAKSSVLYAAAKEIGAACESENIDFTKCKQKDNDPHACLEAGARVQDCALGVLKSAMTTCGEALSSYASCIDRQISQEYMFDRCRAEEAVFHDCRAMSAANVAVIAAKAPEKEGKNPTDQSSNKS